MAEYSYTAIREADSFYFKGKVSERGKKRAVAKLKADGLLIVQIKKEGTSFFKQEINLLGISRQDKIQFTRHLHVFIDAGIALDRAIKIAAEQMTNKKFKDLLWDIYENIVKGRTLSSSLANHKKYFSPYFINLIKLGEESGRLDEVLKQLLEQQEKDYELLTKVRGAMIYPAVILTAAVAVVVFMMTFVVPTISSVLLDYGGTLPLPTKILIATSDFFINYGLFLLPLVVLCIFLLRLAAKTPRGKAYYEKIIFKLPLVGQINREFNLARFTRSMSGPLISGVSIDKSLLLTADACQNSHYKKSLKEAIKLVRHGVPLSETLGAHPKLYPPNVRHMLEVGEKTGKFDYMFVKLASFYEKSVANTFANLSSVIEPFLIIFLGFVVAFIAVSILTPLWRFTDTI